ncbi:MAG TPA: GNAT family N-acetyltransferase [Blastocatellia bacterium]|nr:GNAT family N-acetyltransferase [Blastocatellia bacterium]HMX28786.1 GNAT family N-acetyltransferase [Blastocatellia bacterium]HMY71970.1 GNAT family N-acetyltransferase [Blastocatellia bacterium]HMZ16970.1 GNAT family N-acetyltransferase [Blastocatellia bacterium]HNG30386.1 GNAT family N-acetyltransferase [Blastocatellia bacterium]
MNPEPTTQISFRKAVVEEADFIARLVNSAYRGNAGQAGWTSEADLLDGQRTDLEEVQSLIQSADSMILLCLQHSEVIGSVLLQNHETSAYLGMFVVRPDLQGNGIGKQFLLAAERTAQQEWGVTKITMSVITLRQELIAFYQRRGYRRTGQTMPFPDNPAAGIPKVPNLQFEILEKNLIPA